MALGIKQIKHTFNNNKFDSGDLGEIKAAEIDLSTVVAPTDGELLLLAGTFIRL